MTQDPIQVEGESAKDILAFLNLVKRDLQRLPVLDISKIKWAKPPKGIRSSVRRRPRAGWSAAFKKMREAGDDRLLIDDRLDLDFAGWEW